jgi:hypothetical protein
MYNSHVLEITKYELDQSLKYINREVSEANKHNLKKCRFEVPYEYVDILFIDKYKPLIIDQLKVIFVPYKIKLSYEFIKNTVQTSIHDIESNFDYISNGKWWITIVLQ